MYAVCSLILLSLFGAATSTSNNVCPTWWDYWITRFNSRCMYNDDLYLDLPSLSAKYGFPVKVHNVTTEDGYVLHLFRIQGGGKSVLVVHGIYQNGAGWFMQGNNSMAYVLARRGFDVWVANLRGTKYSLGHANASISQSDYWNFSVHEMGTKDYKAILEYIYEANGGKKIVSVNFSLGTTTSFIYTSTFATEAQKYLERVVALAPIGYLRQNRSILGWLWPLWVPLSWWLKLIGTNYVMTPSENGWMPWFMFLMTPIHMLYYRFVMGLIFGFDMDQFNPWTLPIIVNRSGDSIGVNIIDHFVQIIRRDVLQALDYHSAEQNIAHYGSEAPPTYDLSAIQVPVTCIHGANDAFATPANVAKTFAGLTKSVSACRIELNYTRFNHQDFVIAKDANEMLYTPLVTSWIDGACPTAG